MGTGLKVTQNSINLTPGPGDYSRTQGIPSRTHHHQSRFGHNQNLNFGLKNLHEQSAFLSTDKSPKRSSPIKAFKAM